MRSYDFDGIVALHKKVRLSKAVLEKRFSTEMTHVIGDQIDAGASRLRSRELDFVSPASLACCGVHELGSDFPRLARPMLDSCHCDHGAKGHRLRLTDRHFARFPAGNRHPMHTKAQSELLLGHL